MKKSLRDKKVWIIGAILSVIGIGVPFLVLVITLNVENASPFHYPAMLGAFFAIYILVGFIWGDLHTVGFRRKTKNWDGELPESVKVESWARRWPFYFAAILVFVVFMIFEIMYWVNGVYPFLGK